MFLLKAMTSLTIDSDLQQQVAANFDVSPYLHNAPLVVFVGIYVYLTNIDKGEWAEDSMTVNRCCLLFD